MVDWLSLPAVIVVDAGGVTFYDSVDLFAERDPEATHFPATAAPVKLPGGYYIEAGYSGLEGELCYGFGPEDDAHECEDVCFSHLCVHPTEGLTGGEGTWWPHYTVYQRRD